MARPSGKQGKPSNKENKQVSFVFTTTGMDKGNSTEYFMFKAFEKHYNTDTKKLYNRLLGNINIYSAMAEEKTHETEDYCVS